MIEDTDSVTKENYQTLQGCIFLPVNWRKQNSANNIQLLQGLNEISRKAYGNHLKCLLLLLDLPGKSREERSLEGYSPKGHKESEVTEHAHRRTRLPSPFHLGEQDNS